MSDATLITGITPGRELGFRFNGRQVRGFEGEAVAAALMRDGLRQTRLTASDASPRGYYCGMGVCWECVVEVEGIGPVKACQFPVSEGLGVRSLVPALHAPHKEAQND